MSAIQQGIILMWGGTNATIPAGWERVTELDGKFPKAWGAQAPNITGGADTHTHTSPAHSHSMVDHTHSGQTTRNGEFETEGGNDNNVARDAHVHDYNIAGTQGGALTDAITYQAGSSLPPYHDVIFIRPATVPRPLPAETIALFAESTLPVGWNECNGLNSTPDMRNRFIRGAGSGGNAGGQGGALTHTHSVNHTHSNANHTHQGGSGWDSDYNSNLGRFGNSGGGMATARHTHTVYLANVAEGSSAYSGTAGSAETVQPAYKKVRAIKNNTGSFSKPKGIIALWLGDPNDLPQGWILCDGQGGTPDLRDKFIKVANDATEIGETGGANTHSHALSNSHTHSALGAHSHSGSTSHKSEDGSTNANSNGVSKGHSHNIASCTSNTSSWNASQIQANASDNQPAYRTAVFMYLQNPNLGGAFLYNEL